MYCIGICGCNLDKLDSAITRFKRFGCHIKFDQMETEYINNVLKWANIDLDINDKIISP